MATVVDYDINFTGDESFLATTISQSIEDEERRLAESYLDIASIGLPSYPALYSSESGGIAKYDDLGVAVWREPPVHMDDAQVGDPVPEGLILVPLNEAAHQDRRHEHSHGFCNRRCPSPNSCKRCFGPWCNGKTASQGKETSVSDWNGCSNKLSLNNQPLSLFSWQFPKFTK